MARITYVKHAQQRYQTVPVIDENGVPKQTPVMRGGVQRTTKRGSPIFRTVTIENKNCPLPNLKCDKCKTEITPGDPYKWIAPKSGPYGGRRLVRCGTCPPWQVWEYSFSLSARLAQLQNDAEEEFNLTFFESEDDVTEFFKHVSEMIQELATEKVEAADNIEDGFGHETSQSEELRSQAGELEAWSDEFTTAEIPEYPENAMAQCEECGGTGEADSEDEDAGIKPCEECNGEGETERLEPDEADLDAWLEEVSTLFQGLIEACPL